MGTKKLHKSVQLLVAYAKDNNIDPPVQKKLTDHFFGDGGQLFKKLDEYDARAIMNGFENKGHAYWIESENMKDGSIHPVYLDLKKIAKEGNVSEGGEKAISKTVTGNALPWHELTQHDAALVLTEIQVRGFDEVQWMALKGDLPSKDPDEAAGQETKPAPVSGAAPPASVYDADEDRFVKVTHEQRSLALALQQRLDVATLVTAVILKRMADEKLYLSLGFSSFREYAELRLPFNYRQAHKYAEIGRKFAEYFESEDPNVQSTARDSSKPGQITEDLGSLGVEKLYELSQLEDADFSEILSEGKITLADGTELDLEDIKSQSVQDLNKQLEKHRKYIKDLEAELNTSENEKAKALKRAEQLEADSETGLKYREMFGEKSLEYQAQKSRLAEARSKLLDLNQTLSKIRDIDPEEFDSLAEELRSIHKMMDRALSEIRNQNLEVFRGV